MMKNRMFLFVAAFLFMVACARTEPGVIEGDASGALNGNGSNDDSIGKLNAMPVDDSKISLDSYGESFQAARSAGLKNSRYMEKNCQSVTEWGAWKNLPMKYCRYSSSGQTAEVLMLNPGPRRLTLWLEEACGSLAKSFTRCMEQSYKQIINQSGGQFPVAGIVIEDMDGNGRGNAFAFRNGVTVQIPSFGTGTESTITASMIAKSFTDTVTKTYTYARPISVTREQITKYASSVRLSIPTLGTSSARANSFNELAGDLYQKAWYSSQNHLIRAWIYNQNF